MSSIRNLLQTLILVFVQSLYNFIRKVKRLVQASQQIGHSVGSFSNKTCSFPVICRLIFYSGRISKKFNCLKMAYGITPPPSKNTLFGKILYSSTYAESKKKQLKLIFR